MPRTASDYQLGSKRGHQHDPVFSQSAGIWSAPLVIVSVRVRLTYRAPTDTAARVTSPASRRGFPSRRASIRTLVLVVESAAHSLEPSDPQSVPRLSATWAVAGWPARMALADS